MTFSQESIHEISDCEKLISYIEVHGYKMTLQDFASNCKNSLFSPFTGTGYYATRQGATCFEISYHDAISNLLDYGYSHAYWLPST